MISLTGSGPKGRGFESRHFDQERNPGGVRLPGFFFCLRGAGYVWKVCGELGETLSGKTTEARRANVSRLGEMGEEIHRRPDPAAECRKRTEDAPAGDQDPYGLQRDQLTACPGGGPRPAGGRRRLSDQQRDGADIMRMK